MWFLLAAVATLTPLAAAGLNCSDGFEDLELGDERCYFFSEGTDSKTWTMSFTGCQLKGGDLLSVVDPLHFYPISYRVRQDGADAWVGLLDIPGAKNWADGTPYNDELDQFFNESGSSDIYVFISAEDGLFHTGDGTEKKPYICYEDLTPPPTMPTTTASTTTAPATTLAPCVEPWLQYGQTCYLFSDEQHYWATAAHSCHEQDAEMLSISDSDLVVFLISKAGDGVYWIGLQNENKTYVWEDGTDAAHVEDVLGPYLDEWELGKNCVAFEKEPFPKSFKHESCLTKNGYICYKDVNH